MRSSDINAGDTGTISQYNYLRDDAYASSWLLPHQQSSPDLTLYVEPGTVYFGETRVDFAGGNSPSFTAPATNPRIDVLSINSSGTLVRTAGTEAASPVAPSVPTGEIPICQVYNKVSQTQIVDADATGKGYIYKDTRQFIFKQTTPDVQVFTANGTWTKPAGAKVVQVIVIGGGGGGGTGRGANVSNNRGGGGGGGGGQRICHTYHASRLSSTESVTVASASSAATDGGTSSFGSYITAYGGKAGTSGGSGTGVNGGAGAGIVNNSAAANTDGVHFEGAGATLSAANGKSGVYGGGAGGYAQYTAVGYSGGGSMYSAAGGAGGGGVDAGNPGTSSAGGVGGVINAYTAGGGATGGTVQGGAGTAGTSRSGTGECGNGGGGGAGNNAGTGGAGGAGGAPGGGGGGGGGGTNTGGTGGAGGRGEVIVITW